MAVICLGLTGCGGATDQGPAEGKAIKAVGPATQGTIGVGDIAVGKQYGFAFPILENDDKAPITITGYTVTGVPAGVKVLGYAVYSQSEIKESRMAYVFKPKEADFDLTRFPDHFGQPYTIQPGQQGDRFGMLKIEVTSAKPSVITRCEVQYSQSGQEFTQKVPCTFGVGNS